MFNFPSGSPNRLPLTRALLPTHKDEDACLAPENLFLPDLVALGQDMVLYGSALKRSLGEERYEQYEKERKEVYSAFFTLPGRTPVTWSENLWPRMLGLNVAYILEQRALALYEDLGHRVTFRIAARKLRKVLHSSNEGDRKAVSDYDLGQWLYNLALVLPLVLPHYISDIELIRHAIGMKKFYQWHNPYNKSRHLRDNRSPEILRDDLTHFQHGQCFTKYKLKPTHDRATQTGDIATDVETHTAVGTGQSGSTQTEKDASQAEKNAPEAAEEVPAPVPEYDETDIPPAPHTYHEILPPFPKPAPTTATTHTRDTQTEHDAPQPEQEVPQPEQGVPKLAEEAPTPVPEYKDTETPPAPHTYHEILPPFPEPAPTTTTTHSHNTQIEQDALEAAEQAPAPDGSCVDPGTLPEERASTYDEDFPPLPRPAPALVLNWRPLARDLPIDQVDAGTQEDTSQRGRGRRRDRGQDHGNRGRGRGDGGRGRGDEGRGGGRSRSRRSKH